MATKAISVDVPVGRSAWIATDNVRYDEKGNWLGREVVQVEHTFSREEAQRLQKILGCPECGGGGIGEHHSYFVKTGQDGFGSVDGYTKQCTRKSV